MCRSARLGFNSFRLIKRLPEATEMPPRYSQASFSLRAPWLAVLVVESEAHCLVSCEFILGDCVFKFGVQMKVNERVTSHQVLVLSVKNNWQIYGVISSESQRNSRGEPRQSRRIFRLLSKWLRPCKTP